MVEGILDSPHRAERETALLREGGAMEMTGELRGEKWVPPHTSFGSTDRMVRKNSSHAQNKGQENMYLRRCEDRGNLT